MSDIKHLATCSYDWGFYMPSLKSCCETGKGQPFSQSET